MTTYIFFILGFFILIKGANILIDGSVSVAKKFKISSIVIGLTIIAFGTSMPELIVNIFANAQGNTEIVIGNILGSNIVNILFILGISAVIYPITANKNTVLKEIPFSLLAIVVLGIMANDIIIDGQIFSIVTRIDGLILISFFIIFLYYIFGITKSVEDIVEKDEIKVFSYSKAVFYIILGIVGLIVGGKWIVDG
ncbi:MAG: Na+/Ca+ antiporter, CaCA family, partial [Candidatus Roizmanbacteria bacterium GW2011_GWA2_32_13]